MLITREGDYAIRLIRGLADGNSHPIRTLAEEQDVPWKFAYKILHKLKEAGYVQNTRGVSGGCHLEKPLCDITLFDLLAALDNRCYVNECTRPDYFCEWTEGTGRACRLHQKLLQIQKDIDSELEKYTLADLITRTPVQNT